MAREPVTGSSARRVSALERASARRRRLDNTLRATLAVQHSELAQRQAARDARVQRVEQEASVLRVYLQRIEAMMSGSESFSLDQMNGSRLYIDVVRERLRAREAELAQSEALVKASTDAIAQTQYEIALNMGRIDLCSEQIDQIRRRHDESASDASDEEAEEIAMARKLQQRSEQA
jgi:type III secretion system HrpB7-like protein